MDELNDNNDVDTSIAKNNDYSLMVGDIVAVKWGEENEIPGGDKWWLLHVPNLLVAAMCQDFGKKCYHPHNNLNKAMH